MGLFKKTQKNIKIRIKIKFIAVFLISFAQKLCYEKIYMVSVGNFGGYCVGVQFA